MNKTSLIPQFAITPYLCPDCESVASHANYPKCNIEPTTGSLLPEIIGKNMDETKEKLAKIEQYLPEILKLQSNHLPEKKQTNQHQGSLSFFLRDLIDVNVHLYSLCPVPSFDDISVEVLIKQCLDFQTPADRSAWAIHYYCKKQEIAKKDLTEKYMKAFDELRDKKNEIGQVTYYTKLAYSLYIRNLLDHMKILRFLIKNVGYLDLSIFKSEIITTYCLLEEIFRTNKAKDYLSLFSDSLQTTGSALVQFGYFINDPMIYSLMDDIKTYQTDERAHVISEKIQPFKLDYFTHFRNLIFGLYDSLDPKLILSIMSHYLVDANSDEIKQFLIKICDVVNWFPQKNNSISSVISYLIHELLPKDETRISFIYDFFNFDFG